MSVSHVSPHVPRFLHLHRHTAHRTRSRLERQHIIRGVLVAVGITLSGIVIAGIVGMAMTDHATPGPSSSYGADGSSWVNPPAISTLWLAVTLMGVVALIGFGILTAFRNQQ